MLKSILCKLIILFFLGQGSLVWGANIIKNGNFEDGNSGWIEWSSPNGWFTDVFEHDYAHGCDTWVPIPYPYSGEHTHCQKVGTDKAHGGLYQVITVVKGRKYTVSGQWYGGSGGLNMSDPNTFSVWHEITVYDGAVGATEIDAGVGANDVIIAKKEHTGSAVYYFGWESFSGTFTAQSSRVTLAFKTGKVGKWEAIASYLDNISVYEFFWPMFIPPISRSVEP